MRDPFPPPSTHTLFFSGSPSHPLQLTNPASPNRQQRGVNELLANLRRTSTPPNQAAEHPVAAPSVPPLIREILRLPETPAPLPRTRNRYRLDARGRRLPAGPPPPRSWQTVRRRGGDDGVGSVRVDGAAAVLPGECVPGQGSLVDILLRLVAREWDFLGPHEELGLWTLPDGIRQALLRYLDVYRDGDVSLSDLRAILVPDEEDDTSSGNAYFTHLHVPTSLLTASTFPQLIALLFPKPKATPRDEEPHESWEVADLSPSPPGHLLPALTHLSLALSPSRSTTAPPPSWRHLLQLAKRLPGLTHLSLAFWPEPMRTPNARLASVVGPQGTAVQYGGTGFYSHSLDGDWSEAVNILRALSRSLYRLEYLDVTGCGAWLPALVRGGETVVDEEGAVGVTGVDWAGDWGKVGVLRMGSGVRVTGEEGEKETERLRTGVEMAGVVERHVTAQRAGTGRIVNVERDDLYALR